MSTDKSIIGISRRDWFAGMALQGMLSNSKGLSALIRAGEKDGMDHEESVSGVAVRFADALIKALDSPLPTS